MPTKGAYGIIDIMSLVDRDPVLHACVLPAAKLLEERLVTLLLDGHNVLHFRTCLGCEKPLNWLFCRNCLQKALAKEF